MYKQTLFCGLRSISGGFFPLIMIFMVFMVVSLSAQAAPTGSGGFDIAQVQAALGDTGLGTVPAAQPASLFFIIMRITLSLLVLTIVIVALLWVLKKMGLSGSSKLGGNGNMDLIETLPLGQNRSVVLVRLMDTVLVLSQSGNHTALLDKIEGPKALELIATNREGTVDMAHFKDVFNTFVDKLKKPESRS